MFNRFSPAIEATRSMTDVHRAISSRKKNIARGMKQIQFIEFTLDRIMQLYKKK